MSRMERYQATVSLGDETSQMWSLNKRLEAYLSRVKALEEENELLRAEIHHLRAKSETPSVRKYHHEIMKLRDALDDGQQKMVEVEMDRENLYQEIELVTEMCLQEKQAQEDAKKELCESKKLLEEEKRAQIWLKEKLVHLEEEIEDILRAHEEEKAAMEEEMSSLSQRLDNFKVAPVSFQPVNVQDYAAQLSQIWQRAVEEYKSEVSALEDNLSQANENLRKVLDENKQSQLQLQNLERELLSLKSRKEMLEELLAKQWLEQQEEEGKLQMDIESLEKEKQDLRVQIAQVLEDRQQLMHLKMSLSLEVATYRSLLEAESTRIYSPTPDHKLSSPFSDLMLEKSTLRKRQAESTKTVARDYRVSSTKRQNAEKSELLAHTPSRYQNVKNTSFSNRASPVTKEFQKVSSVLQSHSIKYTKASSEKAATLPSVESNFQTRPPTENVFRKSKVETISKSYSQGPSKAGETETVKLETKVQPLKKNIYSEKKAEVKTTTESIDNVDNGFLLPSEEEILRSCLKTSSLESSLEILKDNQPSVNNVVLENQQASLKVNIDVQETVETVEKEDTEHIVEKEEVVREVVSCQRVLQEVVQCHEYQNVETVVKENIEEHAEELDISQPFTSDTKVSLIPSQINEQEDLNMHISVEKEKTEPPAADTTNVISQKQDFEDELLFDLEHAISPSITVTKQSAEEKDTFMESNLQEEDLIMNQQQFQELNTVQESTNQLFTNEEDIKSKSQAEQTAVEPSIKDGGIVDGDQVFEEYTDSQVNEEPKEIDIEVKPETQIIEESFESNLEGESEQQKTQIIYVTEEITEQFSVNEINQQLEIDQLPENVVEREESSQKMESLKLSDTEQDSHDIYCPEESTTEFTDDVTKLKAEEDTQDAKLFENVVDTQAEQEQTLLETRVVEPDQSNLEYELNTELSEDNQSKISDHSIGGYVQLIADDSAELAEKSQEQLWDSKQDSIITSEEPEGNLQSGQEQEDDIEPAEDIKPAVETESESFTSEVIIDEPEIVNTVEESQSEKHDIEESVSESGKTEENISESEVLQESVASVPLKQEVELESQEQEPSYKDVDEEIKADFQQQSEEEPVQLTEKETIQESYEALSLAEEDASLLNTEATVTFHHESTEEHFNQVTKEVLSQTHFESISKTVEPDNFVEEEEDRKEHGDSEAGAEFETFSSVEPKITFEQKNEKEHFDEGAETEISLENKEVVSSVEEHVTSENKEITQLVQKESDDAEDDNRSTIALEIPSESFISGSENTENGEAIQASRDLDTAEGLEVGQAMTDTECKMTSYQESTEELFEEGSEEGKSEEIVSKTTEQDVSEEIKEYGSSSGGTDADQDQKHVQAPLPDAEEQQKNEQACFDKAAEEDISQETEDEVSKTSEKENDGEDTEDSKQFNDLEEASQKSEDPKAKQEIEGIEDHHSDTEVQPSFQCESEHETFERSDDIDELTEHKDEVVFKQEDNIILEEIKETRQLIQSEHHVSFQLESEHETFEQSEDIEELTEHKDEVVSKEEDYTTLEENMEARQLIQSEPHVGFQLESENETFEWSDDIEGVTEHKDEVVSKEEDVSTLEEIKETRQLIQSEPDISFQLESEHETFERSDNKEKLTEHKDEVVSKEEDYSTLEEIKEARQLIQPEPDVGEQESQLNDTEAPTEVSVDSAACPVLNTEVELASSEVYEQETELDAEHLEVKSTYQQENEDECLKQSEGKEAVSEVNNEVASITEEYNTTEDNETASLIQEEPEDDHKIAFSLNIIQNNLRFTSDNDTEIQQEIIGLSTEREEACEDLSDDSANIQSYGTELDSLTISHPIKEEVISEDKDITENKDEKESFEDEVVNEASYQVSTGVAGINKQFEDQEQYLEPEPSKQVEEQPADISETESENILVEHKTEQNIFAEKPSETLDFEHQSDIEEEISKSDESLDSQGISLYSQRSEDFEISKDYQLEQTLPDSTPLPNLDEEFEDLAEDHIIITSDQSQNVTRLELPSESKEEEVLDDSLESQSSQTAMEAILSKDNESETKYDDNLAEALDDNTFGTSDEATFDSQNQLEDLDVRKVENEDIPSTVQENVSLYLEKSEEIEAHKLYHLGETMLDTTPLSNLNDNLPKEQQDVQSEQQESENIEGLKNEDDLAVECTKENESQSEELTPTAELDVLTTEEDNADLKPSNIISEDDKSLETEEHKINEDESDIVTKELIVAQSTEVVTGSHETEDDYNKECIQYGNNEDNKEIKDDVLIKTSEDYELKDVEAEVQDAVTQADANVIKHPSEERVHLESDDSASSDEASPNVSFSHVPEAEESRTDVILESFPDVKVTDGSEEFETAELESVEQKETQYDETLLTTEASQDASVPKQAEFPTSDEEKDTTGDHNDSSFDSNSGNEQELAEEHLQSTENHIPIKAMNGHHEHTVVQATLDFEDPFLNGHSTLEQSKIVISEKKTIVKVEEDIINAHTQDFIEESVLKFAASEGKSEGLFQSLLEKSELKESVRLDESSELQKTIHAAFEYMDSAAEEGSYTKKTLNPYLDDSDFNNQSEIKSPLVGEDLIVSTDTDKQTVESHQDTLGFQQEAEDLLSPDE